MVIGLIKIPARRLAAARPHPGSAPRGRWWSRTDRVATTVQRLDAWREHRPKLGCPPGPVLAIGAHPDDESLAFGGTLARLVEAGASVHVLCATAGEASRAGPRPSRLGPRRRAELHIACEWLGVSDVECLGLPDGGLSAQLDQLSMPCLG